VDCCCNSSKTLSQPPVTYVTLIDYNSRTRKDLSFRKGEQISKPNENWWKARSNQFGIIPSKFVVAEALLRPMSGSCV